MDSQRFCDQAATTTAAQQDRLLRFAAIAKQLLEASGAEVALVARNGTNLRRFKVRYSHAGISVKAHAQGPWAVRQLYYACDERRPRLFDQGLSGFMLGTDDLDLSYVSLVLLPGADGAAVVDAALHGPRALGLLGATYSANAHPYTLAYQNCNQWVAELLATAWGGLAEGPAQRARAQGWLAAQGYAPEPVNVASHALMFLAPFMAMIHTDDHPEEDRFALRFRTSLPAALERLARERVQGVQRIELCHDTRHVVIHRGWSELAEGCEPGPGDEVIPWQ